MMLELYFNKQPYPRLVNENKYRVIEIKKLEEQLKQSESKIESMERLIKDLNEEVNELNLKK